MKKLDKGKRNFGICLIISAIFMLIMAIYSSFYDSNASNMLIKIKFWSAMSWTIAAGIFFMAGIKILANMSNFYENLPKKFKSFFEPEP